MAPPSMDYWLGFFRGAGDSIFDAIDAAIAVAASDHPAALRSRRDAIAERLYTAHLVPGAPPAVPPAGGGGASADAPPAQLLLHPEGAASVPSLCSSDRAEVITDDDGAVPRRDDDPVAAETERIKAILLNDQEKSEATLLELLRRLQQLELTVDTLTVTEIGKAVSSYRKHNSKQIRHLVRLLIEGWKRIVDEWMSSRDAIVDHTPQSMHPSGLEQDERGLSSPSMDEGALFATPSTSIRLSEENQGSKFFDGMDDDGNTRSNGGRDNGRLYTRNQEPARRPLPPVAQQYDPDQSWKQEQSAMRQSKPQELSNGQTREQFIAAMLARPSNPESGPGRPQPRTKQHQDASPAQGRSQPMPSDKPASHHDENSVRAKLELAKNAKLELTNSAKLEVTKRKLQEGYQEFDNAKKQRTIQMVDPQNLPKQANRNWQPNGRPRNNSNFNNNRNWSR
uniref:TFIIS N-terminal domain-containing protein n=1 Tax=Oryza nivara TaxID=4536 RepID=A0A0E0I4R3_ORYNI